MHRRESRKRTRGGKKPGLTRNEPHEGRAWRSRHGFVNPAVSRINQRFRRFLGLTCARRPGLCYRVSRYFEKPMIDETKFIEDHSMAGAESAIAGSGDELSVRNEAILQVHPLVSDFDAASISGGGVAFPHC